MEKNTIIHILITAGFTFDSVVQAVAADDLTLLRYGDSDEK